MTYMAELTRRENTQQGIAKRIRYEKLTSEWAEERKSEIALTLEAIDKFKITSCAIGGGNV